MRRTTRRTFSWLLTVLTVVWMTLPVAGHAQTCTASLGTLDFGNYSPVSGGAGAVSSTINISCSGLGLATAVRACLSIGTGNGGATVGPRKLANGATQLNFELSPNSGGSPPWGARGTANALIQVDFNALLGNGSTTVPIYASLPAGQNVAAGVYQSNFNSTHTEMTYRSNLLGLVAGCASITSPVARFPFQVKATVINDCLISANDIVFPVSGVLATTIAATGTVTAKCTQGSSYTITLNAGTGTGSTITSRRMTRLTGTQQVQYQLHQNASYTLPWGNGTGGTTGVAGTGTGLNQNYTVYARVLPQTTPVAGTYVDTITATVTY